MILFFFFFNDTATTEIYTLSLHDALPIFTNCTVSGNTAAHGGGTFNAGTLTIVNCTVSGKDRKSTRLNSSHSQISYAVFCLKKKKNNTSCSVRRRSAVSSRRFAYSSSCSS